MVTGDQTAGPMMHMSKHFIGLLSWLVCAQLLPAQEPYTVTRPYDFPVKPGTEAWAAAGGHTVEACQIPNELVKKMSTEALLQTCLAYPFGSPVFFDSDTSPDSALKRQFFNQFNGFKELAARKDVGVCVLDYYRHFAGSVKKGERRQILDVSLAHWLFFSRQEIMARYTPDQKEQLAILCFRVAIYFDKAPELGNSAIEAAGPGLRFLVDHRVVIHREGATFDQSKLPAAALKFLHGETITERDWFSHFLKLIAPYVL